MSKQMFYGTIVVTGEFEDEDQANEHGLSVLVAGFNNALKAIMTEGDLEQSGTTVVHIVPGGIHVHTFSNGGFMNKDINGIAPAVFSRRAN